MTYNGFEYNKFGVCINPEIPYEFGGKVNDDSFNIEVSETAAGWIFGWRWGTPSSGGGSPCSPSHKSAYKTRSEAIIAAAIEIRKEFATRNRHKAVAELNRIIAEESKLKQIRQMTIFDML